MSLITTIKLNANDFISKGENRKYIVLAVLAMFCIIYAFSSDTNPEDLATAPIQTTKQKQYSFFTTKGAEQIEKDQLDDIMQVMEKQVAKRESEMDAREESANNLKTSLMSELESLRLAQNDMKRDFELNKKEMLRKTSFIQPITKQPTFAKQSTQPPAAVPVNQVEQNGQQQLRAVAQGQQQLNYNPQNMQVGSRTIDATGDRWIDAAGKLTEQETIVQTESEEVFTDLKNELEMEEEVVETEIYLPAGSMISGILLTGMDVPTGSSSTKDPYPAILRIKEDALLPNNFSLDIRDCIIITSAKGDLSSRRAIFRAETISCITEDGKAIEANLTAFSVGQDGKTGISGKLVTRNTEIALKAAATGFLSGLADVFSTTEISVGDNETGVYSIFTDPNAMADLAGASALKGTAKGLNQLTEYYIELVEEMKPYLEINAGLTVDFIVQRGTSLRTK